MGLHRCGRFYIRALLYRGMRRRGEQGNRDQTTNAAVPPPLLHDHPHVRAAAFVRSPESAVTLSAKLLSHDNEAEEVVEEDSDPDLNPVTREAVDDGVEMIDDLAYDLMRIV
jgi:hypothetical protein